ncbi:MAG TPA: ABC transporter permease, partial [Candidatus Binataceae bacterium]|nr:ABC transporter permease [Candidatus Binataceae bacterium]
PATVVIEIAGSWRMRRGMPTVRTVEDALLSPLPRAIVLDARDLTGWDSSLVSFLAGVAEFCARRGIRLDRGALPKGLNRLLDLAAAVPEKTQARAAGATPGAIDRIGARMLAYAESAGRFIEFVGRVAIALGSLATGRARVRASDLMEELQKCGADALPIVTLISFLVGIILAFMGAVQLQQFGASIYVADLVAIGNVREMGAMMTGVIMSGRIGAAFAAELGTMKVTQEIDALSTMGISPVEFLVAPRFVAMVLMMPLLALYADFIGILGGAAVGIGTLGMSFQTYMHETAAVVTFSAIAGGLFKATVYGMLIALAGCYQGFECGNSSSAVGDAATAAVVDSIVMIVVACGIFAVLFNILRI